MGTERSGTSVPCFEKGENNMLQIKNLTKRYGDKLAVDNLSLHIMPGRYMVSSDTTGQVRQPL